MSTRIAVQHAAQFDEIPADEVLISWAERALKTATDHSGEVCLRITDADEIRALNHRYRDRDQTTNVLSFSGDAESGWLGDIVMCVEVIAREAQQQGKPAEHHWAHMVIHGVLHLLGYDHVDEEQAISMESLEVSLLASGGIPDPYSLNNSVTRRATAP